MSVSTQTPETPAKETATPEAPPTEETSTAETPHEGEKALGDAGKKALDAMKAERNEYKRLAAEAKNELERLKAEGRKAEYEAEQQQRRVKEAALAEANKRIALAELRAAAKGKKLRKNLAEVFDWIETGAVPPLISCLCIAGVKASIKTKDNPSLLPNIGRSGGASLF